MALHLHGFALDPDDDQGGDGEPGPLLYQTIGDAIRGCPQPTLIDLLGAIQRGDPWPRLPATVRQVFDDLGAVVFEEGEE